jgi:ABC-type oligopeptide transport system ATPase subunit
VSDAILEAVDLVKEFPIRGGVFGRTQAVVSAVDGVNLQVNENETLGLVGESGAASRPPVGCCCI